MPPPGTGSTKDCARRARSTIATNLPTPAAGTPTARNGRPPQQLPTRRELFALAAVLAATVLTGGAAIAGLTRQVPVAQPSPPVVDGIVRQAPAPTPPPRVEPGD